MTAGRMTYDLRRLRLHGIIERIPHTNRYQVTPFGLQDRAIFFTRTYSRLLRTGLAEICDPTADRDPATPPLRPARAHDHRSGRRSRSGRLKLDSTVPASPAQAS